MMQADLRNSFHNQLGELDRVLAGMFEAVKDGMAIARDAVSGTGESFAHDLRLRDRRVDALRNQVEAIVEWQLARQQPMGRDLRLLLTAVHIAPELERSHDLVVHVTRRSALVQLAAEPCRRRLLAMAEEAEDMWKVTSAAYAGRDATAAARLRRQDTVLDDLQREVVVELGRCEMTAGDAVGLVLMARFFERLGDHAVNLADRTHFLVTGPPR